MLRLFVAFAALAALGAQPAHADYNYYAAALQGDLSQADAALGESPDEADRELLSKFRARFIDRSDGLDFSAIDDPAVRAVAQAYQDYWRDSLLTPDRSAELEIALMRRVRDIVGEADPAAVEGRLTDEQLSRLEDGPDARQGRGRAMVGLADWIEGRGFQAITGRTSPLLELMIWRENRVETEHVALTDGVQDVRVTYMEEFVVRGWASFATFETRMAAGWANENGLFSVSERWDLASEKFRVSFLAHEARHYADDSLYPNLSSADLEYRAKLTELIFADASLHGLLAKFAETGARVAGAPHPLANWHVINDLGAEVDGDDAPENWWTEAARDDVQTAARRLLDRNDRLLNEAGATTTEGVITP